MEGSPDSSRPSSPAQSDATEVPDFSRAPRTVANDIEHIKSLISRADGIVRAPESSITAQVFRSRSGSTGSTGSAGPISQQRIFHELDLLKKRIRNEQHHIRRPSQIDPETESESEAIDEREEELENIRDQLLLERQRSEDLLANAETRIDGLIKEKEDLALQLRTHQDDLGSVHGKLQEHTARLTLEEREKDSLREQLQTRDGLHQQQIKSAEVRLAEMEQQIHEYEQRARAAEEKAKRSETELHEKLTAREHELADVQGQLAELQHKVYEQSAELDGKNAELAEATEHAYRMYDERDNAHDDALRALRATHVAERDREVAATNARWTDEVARLKVEHQQALAELEQGWSSQAEEAARSHHAELSSAQREHETKLAALRADAERRTPRVGERSTADDSADAGALSVSMLSAQLESARKDFEAVKQKLTAAQQQNWTQLIQFQEKHDRALASHVAEKQDLQRSHLNTLEDLETQNQELRRQVDELKILHQEYNRPAGLAHGESSEHISKALGTLEECTRQLQRVHAAEVEGMQNTYHTSIRELEENATAELKNVRQVLQEALEFAKQEGVVALDIAYREHEESKRDLETQVLAAKNATKAQLADLDVQHQKALKALELSKGEDLESQREEHERAIRTLLRSHKNELSSVEETHQQQLLDLAESMRAEQTSARSAQTADTLNRQQKALERAIGEAHDSSQAEMEALRKTHKRELSRLQAEAEKELAVALAEADEDLEERLHAQALVHRKELDTLNESLNVELTHLHLQLEEASQMRQERMEEMEEQHHTLSDELRQRLEAAEQTAQALQARLDAEAIGRVDAERSLANLKKERFNEIPVESKANLRRSIIILEAERDNLARQLASSPTSNYSDTHEAASSVANGEYETDDAALLRQRLTAAERERDEAQTDAERKIDEMTRQTDFLVKELELAMAQRGAAQAFQSTSADASVQTESVAVLDPRALLEPKADASVSRVAKIPRPDSRRSITDIAESTDKRRSFEDYLQQAQAELSDLSTITSVNEDLFAEKTREHAGMLQSAKDQLSAEYHRKFRALQAEKERMERAIAAKSASDFTREHDNLFAIHGLSHNDPVKQAAMFHNLPARKKKTIQNAEQDLVTDYQRRLTKRKAQIALKHAEKFHSLTREFHQRTADLLSGKEPLPAANEDIQPDSVESTSSTASTPRPRELLGKAVMERSTIDKGQLENALRAAANTAPKSHLPKRISISVPRTVTSIPRAVPFSGRAVPLTSSTPPREPRNLNAALPPTPQSDISSPSTTNGHHTSMISERTSSYSLVTSPLDRASEGSMAGSSAGSSSSRPKSRPRMSHSSRMIFGVQST